ncbi:MAG TPA: phosphohydrolase [Candidatus Goldiibacteriota bacterium]|nr:phosphohydrolase [Candidatus Goldiibacteriota bacterium]
MADLSAARKEYEELLSRILSRKGVKDLNAYLEKHGLYSAPASTKYHLCFEGGLVIHVTGVAKLALKLKKELLPDFPDESVILCSLFHDAHKVTDGFGHSTYMKNEEWNRDKQPYNWNREQLGYGNAHKSALLVSKFVDLTQDELQAIAYHDGPFVPSWEDIKGDPYPLTLLIHYADMWSTWVVEKVRNLGRRENRFIGDKE